MFETNFKKTPNIVLSQNNNIAASWNLVFGMPKDGDFGMKKKFLADDVNLKIISALDKIGVRNVTSKDLGYFSGALSEDYLQALDASTNEDDRKTAYAYRKGVMPAFTHKNFFDKGGSIYTYVDESYADELVKNYGFSKQDALLHILTHEVAHQPTHNLLYGKDLSEGELVADYVGLKASGAENFLYVNFCPREDKYSLSRAAAYGAFQEVVSTIDERLGAKMGIDAKESPLARAIARCNAIDYRRNEIPANEKVKAVFDDEIAKFYDANIRQLEGAPRTVREFMRRVVNQFEMDMESKAKKIVATRLASAV